MIRRLLNVLTILSGALVVAAAALWVRGYWVADLVDVRPGPARPMLTVPPLNPPMVSTQKLRVVHYRGRWLVARWSVAGEVPLRWDRWELNVRGGATPIDIADVERLEEIRPWGPITLGGRTFPASSDRRLMGFRRTAAPLLGTSTVSVPDYAPAAVFALLPAARVAAHGRRRVRDARMRRAGRCVRCGYDLRASPGRCPECGAATAGGSENDRTRASVVDIASGTCPPYVTPASPRLSLRARHAAIALLPLPVLRERVGVRAFFLSE